MLHRQKGAAEAEKNDQTSKPPGKENKENEQQKAEGRSLSCYNPMLIIGLPWNLKRACFSGMVACAIGFTHKILLYTLSSTTYV